MSQPIDRDNPNFTYKKKEIDIRQSSEGYPIMERTNNGLVFPEGPKDIVDFIDYEDI